MTLFNQHLKRAWSPFVGVLAVLVLWMPLAARQSLDRTKIPSSGKPPVLRVPRGRNRSCRTAPNLSCRKNYLPLVLLTITFIGGSNQFESAESCVGLAGIVAGNDERWNEEQRR